MFLCLALSGCGDTCFVVTGIFPNAASTTNPPTCNLGTGNGTITVGINTAIASPALPMSPNLGHVFITLGGIDANPNADATEDSPDWQELAPHLASEPIQIDLWLRTCPARHARLVSLERQAFAPVPTIRFGCDFSPGRLLQATQCCETTLAEAATSTASWTQMATRAR